MATMAALQSSFTSLSLSSSSFMGQRFSPPLCSSLIAHGSVEFSELCSFQQRRMAWMSREPLVSKLDVLSKYFILLAIMVAAMIYSLPDFATENPKSSSSSS